MRSCFEWCGKSACSHSLEFRPFTSSKSVVVRNEMVRQDWLAGVQSEQQIPLTKCLKQHEKGWLL